MIKRKQKSGREYEKEESFQTRMHMLHFVGLAWSAAIHEESSSFLQQFTGSLIQV